MTGISQNRLKKKQERKRAKMQEKRRKRINSKVDNTITACVLLLAAGIAIMEVFSELNNGRKT